MSYSTRLQGGCSCRAAAGASRHQIPARRPGSAAKEERHDPDRSADDAHSGWDPEGEQPADEPGLDAGEPLGELGSECCAERRDLGVELGKTLCELGVEAREVELVELPK